MHGFFDSLADFQPVGRDKATGCSRQCSIEVAGNAIAYAGLRNREGGAIVAEVDRVTSVKSQYGAQEFSGPLGILGAKRSHFAKNQPVIEGEQLRADDAGEAQAGLLKIIDRTIARPGRMAFGGDHRQHGMPLPIKLFRAQNQGRSLLDGGLVRKWKRNNNNLKGPTDH
jgi:hypothetical protein